MTNVPLIPMRNKLVSQTGCTQTQADLAIRRVGFGATDDALRRAVAIEVAISAAEDAGVCVRQIVTEHLNTQKINSYIERQGQMLA